MKWWKWIVGGFSLLLGLLFFERGKRKSAEALVSNLDTKEKALDLDREGLKHQADLQLEESRRTEASEKLARERDRKLSDDEMVEFLRNPSSDK